VIDHDDDDGRLSAPTLRRRRRDATDFIEAISAGSEK